MRTDPSCQSTTGRKLTRGFSTRFTTTGSLASRALNRGVLPAEYFALPEQSIGAAIPDVLTLELAAGAEEANGAAGVAVATAPPRTRLVRQTEDAV